MKIEKDRIVRFHYSLTDATGAALESSHDGEPMAYLYGHGGMIEGLENALLGRDSGEKFTVTLAPEEAYGKRVEGSFQRIPIKHLQVKKNARLAPGMVVQVQTEQGLRQVTVVKPGKFNVDVDTNHPWAGKTLTFTVEVVDVAEATPEELAHGHAHGAGGHQHH